MRVLIAPDKFAGTLTAVQAAEAIAAGWRETLPGDDLDVAPLSDGGPGFVEVLHAAIGGRLITVSVSGPLGDRVPARLLHHGDTAYVETAQACGLHLVPEDARDAGGSTTYGVGELLAAAIDDGASRCLLGLGGSATNDGGAGMLAGLGAGPAEVLRRGGMALRELCRVDVVPALKRTAAVELVMATDVDNPLLGEDGASAVFGPQKGASEEQTAALDAALSHWAGLVGERWVDEPGAGAAGGLGFGLFVLGGRRESGIDAVLRAVSLDERVGSADLVLTGEGSFDSQSLRGKVPSGVARAAKERGVPCLLLAGRVAVRADEMAGAGVDAAYSVADSAGSVEAAIARPAEELASLAARVARERPNRPRG
ncbi:MAG: glycerate kinase [Streptosporangiales bacterium]|nr:glycerate kinase [Streptosporangiales bacterium]